MRLRSTKKSRELIPIAPFADRRPISPRPSRTTRWEKVAMNQAFLLVSAHAVGLRPNLVTAATARAVALKQNPASDWTALQERPLKSQ
jgi:hypothetical protein